jgi:predicted AlkP superfamily phosphohydrolase/phosphomutase
MDWGQPNLHDCPDAVRVRGSALAPESIGLTCVEIEERSDTTAYHVPEGIFAIYDPQDRSVKPADRPEVSVLEIAPTILDTFGVAVPDYMQSPSLLTTAAGHSLLH